MRKKPFTLTLKEKETIGLIIKDRRNRLGLTLDDLAGAIGSTNAYLSMLENSKRIASDRVLRQITEELDLDYEYLRELSEKERYEREANKIRSKYFEIQKIAQDKCMNLDSSVLYVPILGTVPTQAPLADESETAICVPQNWISEADKIFALQISDDTMTGRLEDTDLVAVKRGLDPENNDIVIVRVNDMIMAKTIEFIGNMVVLRSTNGQPETMHFTEKDKEQMEVIGKVIFRITQAS